MLPFKFKQQNNEFKVVYKLEAQRESKDKHFKAAQNAT